MNPVHRLWIHGGESSTMSNAAQAGTCGGAEDVNLRSGGRDVNWSLATSFSHRPPHRASGALPAMSSQASEIRARALRARLSTLVEVCAELEVPIPLRKLLAPALGATDRQIARYLSILIDQGVVERRTHKSLGRIAA